MVNTTAARLRAALERIVEESLALTRGIAVHRFERDTGPVVFLTVADFYFDTLNAPQQAAQMNVKRRYETFSEVVRVLLRGSSGDAPGAVEGSGRAVPPCVDRARDQLRPHRRQLRERSRAPRGCDGARASPLSIRGRRRLAGCCSCPTRTASSTSPTQLTYRSIAGRDDFRFILLPTVLGELDELKIAHRNPDVREGAKRAITRIKGWRDQARRAGGTLNDGTVFDKTITVQSVHVEPDVKGSLSWLDASVADDRIIAAVLAVAAEHPSARVVLVTGDVNLQNKADAAMVETSDTP